MLTAVGRQLPVTVAAVCRESATVLLIVITRRGLLVATRPPERESTGCVSHRPDMTISYSQPVQIESR